MAEDGVPARTPRREWLRPLVAIAAAVVLLTAVATASVLVVGGSSHASYAADGPQAAFQGWVAAVHSGDWANADTYLSSRLRQHGVVSKSIFGPTSATGAQITIDSARVYGTSATLQITVQHSTGVGVGTTSYTSGTEVQMVREDGAWKLDSEVLGLW